ncbi:hypothetical protein Vadar_003015 [Vaccinium darrowii]|uniref:Uncharacterized protein n=1 Tax=Vaccinium darrowii TaxID=229202 RepID=A0ACB7YBX4_9ERIC|nr:hypothetical protein Vadar_003015 [Vaccinium darrowii]
MDQRRKSFVQLGSKSVELVDEGEGVRQRFRLDASSRYEKVFSRSFGGFVRRLKVNRLVFEGGFLLRVEVKDNGRVRHVLLPELCGIGGWVDVSKKFWAFCGWKSSGGMVDGRSFKDVANISGWPVNTVVVEDSVLNGERHCAIAHGDGVATGLRHGESWQGKEHNSARRCLVGRLEDESLAQPATLDLQRWSSRAWKVSAGIKVTELGGRSFLFTMPSFEEAQRVLKEKWSFDGRRAIGNFCGDFLRVDDDTMQKKHLRWARIAVRAVPAKIPLTVKIAMGGWVFELPVWVEMGPKVVFQPNLELFEGGNGDSGGVRVGRLRRAFQVQDGRGYAAPRSGAGAHLHRPSHYLNSDFSSRRGVGPKRVMDRFERKKDHWNGKGRQVSSTVNYHRSGSDKKWASLFKRPFKSSLVVLKNKKWAKKGDSGGGTSYNSDGFLQSVEVGLNNHLDDRGRTEIFGRSIERTFDDSEVCIISDRSTPSHTSSFSFLDEGDCCPNSNRWSLLGDTRMLESPEMFRIEKVGKGVCEERTAKDSCGGGDNHLVFGGEDADKDRVDEGCYTKGEEDGAVLRGMELMTYSRVDESERSGWVCQNEEEITEEEKLLRDNVKEEFGEDLLVKEEEISVGIANFYESLFQEEVIWRPRVDGIVFDSISGEEASWLERPFDEEEVGGFLQGFEVGSENGAGLMISHILYADDTLLFCNADPTQVGCLRCVLLCFEAASSLKVNLEKSEMIPVGAVDDINGLA